MKSKMSFCNYLLLYFFIPNLLLSQNSLTVGNPKTTGTQKGTIEEAFLSVRNKGLFLEYGLYLTFSARGTTYQSKDSLEIVLNFTLPQKAIVMDSWLWINDNICKAKLFDIWSASSIYEDIVKRRRDLYILIKTTDIQYILKVYPMKATERRKVKITYLVPLDWNAKKVYTSFPINIFNSSKYIPSSLPVIIWPDSEFKNPSINFNQNGLTAGRDSLLGDYQSTILYPASTYSYTEISFDNPMKNGLYMNNYQDKNESIYQIAIQPSQFTDQIKNQKVAILID